MRHLNTEELLLYAESELDDAALCRHVQDCVDCKASLVEVQETFVGAASAIRASVHVESVELQAASLSRLRAGIAAETEKISYHLTPEELLLSSDGELFVDRDTHLAACVSCQREAANLRILLADIEAELRSLMPDEPVERKAAAVVALEKRLSEATDESVVEQPTLAEVIEFPFAPVRKYAPVAAAAAAALVMWGGFEVLQTPELPALPTIARVTPVVSPLAAATPDFVAVAEVESTVPASVSVERYEFAAIEPTIDTNDAIVEFASAPLLAAARPLEAVIPWRAPAQRPYQSVEQPSETVVALVAPAPLRSSAAEAFTLALNSERPVGGMMRNSLLAHYRDAARRSFQSPTISLLEAETERYVSDVLRNDTELLAHVHAVNSLLDQNGQAALTAANDLSREMKRHLDGIANREAAIYATLSEVLPRRFWTYRAESAGDKAETIDAVSEGNALLADALGLDETLTMLFVANTATLDARGDERSCGERLARIRSHVARLRRAIN